MPPWRTLLAPLPLLPLLAACFEYVPVTPDRVEVGMPVRVELTGEGTSRVDGEIGHRLSAVEGTVVQRDASSWVIAAPLPANPGAYVRRDLEQRITLRVEEMAGVGARRVDPFRTALLGGVIVAAAGAALALIFEGDLGGEQEIPGPTPPGEGSVVPVP